MRAVRTQKSSTRQVAAAPAKRKTKPKVSLTKPANSNTPKKGVKSVAVGSKVPDFRMVTTDGSHSRKSLMGSPYVLYFYPKDDTPGCTTEACGFNEALVALKKLGVTVLGVSRDTLKSHEKFAKKYKLKFPLGADESGELCEQFGVWVKKSMYGRTYFGIERSTFLVDKAGVVQALWRNVSVKGHVPEVMKALKALKTR